MSKSSQQTMLPEQTIDMALLRQFFEQEDKFARHCGIKLLQVTPGAARASMDVQPFHLNGACTVHGGAIFTLADFAFAAASNSRGQLAMGINTSISYVKAPTTGTLYADAAEIALNPKLASYTVTITDDQDETIAIFQGMVYRKSQSILPEVNSSQP